MPLILSPTHPEGHMTIAEALIAAELGAISLERRQLVQVGTIGIGAMMIHLHDGPMTEMISLEVGLKPLVAGVHNLRWAVGIPAKHYGQDYTLTYWAGWTNADIPESIRAAVSLMADHLEARPDPTVTSETMGPVSRAWSVNPAAPNALPPHVQALLASWRAVRY